MAIKKFTVMASNAGDGKYISAATFADTLKTAKKKYNEKFKKGPYACAEVNDLGYIYYKTDDGRVFVPNVERTYDFALSQVKKFNAEETDIKSACAAIKAECGKKSVKASDTAKKYRVDIFKKNNPDALVKREYKMFDSEKEAKKYGESIANGDIVNVIEVEASCTKKSVKAGRTKLKPHSEWSNESASRYSIINGRTGDIENGNDKAKLIHKCKSMSDPAWVEDNMLGGIIFNNNAQTQVDFESIDKDSTKSVKSSKYLTVPKSKRKSVKANATAKSVKKFTIKASDNYAMKVKVYVINKGQTGQYYGLKNAEDNQVLYNAPNNWKTKAGAIKWAKKNGFDVIESSKSVKKFGVKASALAKRKAQQRITASDYRDEDIVMYFNGDNVYTGSIYDSGFAETIENLCYDEEVNAKFQEWCNQFGDPFDFDGSPIDTARVFTDIIIHEAEEGPVTNDGGTQFYVDGNGIIDFEIFYANDGIYSAKSIKCSSSDDFSDFDDTMRFRVCSYFDNYYRSIDDCKVFDDFDEAVDFAHECLGKGPTTIEDYEIGTLKIDPDEYWENFDGEFWCMPELAEFRDEVWKSMGIGASKSIKCNDGIAPDDYDSVEDLVPEAYALSGGEDDDMLEYVDDYIATEGCPATVNFVTYNTPNDWSVDVSKYGENVVSDFIWYLEEVASELSDKFYDYPSYEDDTTRNAFKGTKYEEGGKYATFYGDTALAANDYEFQFYPAQNQWSAPQIGFDTDELKLIGFTDDEIDELMRIYEDYKAAWIENCKYINAHISEFLANLESNVNASKNIKADRSLNLNAKPNYTDWMLRGYKFDGEDVTTLRIGFQDDVKKAVMDMFSDPDIETVDLYKIPTEQDTTGVFEDEEYFETITRDDIKAFTEVNADLQLSRYKWDREKYDWSDYKDITGIDEYVKDLADGVVERFPNLTYDISDESITFTDEDGTVVYIQPIDEIFPEKDDLEDDILELGDALQYELGEVVWKKMAEEEFDAHYADDPDYATRAVQLSEDIGEVDIDDLEPITGDGDEVDYGYGFDSNGDALDESTVEELYRIAEYEILPKSELAKIDEYVSIDEDSWDFYMSSPHVTEKFYIHFKLTEKDIDFNKYALPEAAAFPDFNYYTAVLDFDIYTENGEVTSVVLEEVKINRPDGAFDDYDVKRFDKLYNVDAIINYVEALAADTVMDIYNGTTNL